MANKNPEKTAATKRHIKDAFWKLYCNSETESVTASAVAKAAGVNRSTFYEYFHDVHEVLELIEDELIDYIQVKAGTVARTNNPLEAAKIANTILNEKGDYIRVFLGRRHNERILSKCKELLNFLIVHDMLELNNETSSLSSYKAEFISSGLIAVYTRWLEEGQPIPIEELSTMLKKSALASANADQVLENKQSMNSIVSSTESID